MSVSVFSVLVTIYLKAYHTVPHRTAPHRTAPHRTAPAPTPTPTPTPHHTYYLCISGASSVRPVCWWNRYASARCYSGSVFILERVGASRTAMGVAMLLNHKRYFNFNIANINQSINQQINQ